MKLNEAKGNMYSFVTHTANAIKGKCYHDCSYCYMKRFPQKPIRLDEKELKIPMTEGNFIFVGSSCDMFACNISNEWICKVIDHCKEYNNTYLFQSKNPKRMKDFIFPEKTLICTTLESDTFYPEIMNNSPHPMQRSISMQEIMQFEKYVTIEPIMDFHLEHFITMIKRCNPKQVNIGADSGNNNLPEPPPGKILELISELSKFTKINIKNNLKRLL
jgi:DNA repair photolyase